jgi:hypothetical protein
MIDAVTERRLARIGRVEDGILGAPPHHGRSDVQIRCGLTISPFVIVMGALLDLGRDRSSRLWKQCTGLDEGENAIEVRWIMTELLQRAFGYGVERVESPLGQRDVQRPGLASGTICYRSSTCSQPQSRVLPALEERA